MYLSYILSWKWRMSHQNQVNGTFCPRVILLGIVNSMNFSYVFIHLIKFANYVSKGTLKQMVVVCFLFQFSGVPTVFI